VLLGVLALASLVFLAILGLFRLLLDDSPHAAPLLFREAEAAAPHDRPEAAAGDSAN
jgi:hypothetical protein